MITRNYIIGSEVPINTNVAEVKVNPYIPKALRQLRAILPAALYAALQELFEEEVTAWSATNDYVATNKVFHVEDGIVRGWESLTTNSNEEPTTANTTNWSELELGTFLFHYVQPYLAHVVYCAYAVNASVNVSHQGLQEISNETAAALDGTKLQAYLGYWKAEADKLKRVMLKYLDYDNSNTLDGTTYDSINSNKKRSTFRIRQIGGTTRYIDPLNR